MNNKLLFSIFDQYSHMLIQKIKVTREHVKPGNYPVFSSI